MAGTAKENTLAYWEHQYIREMESFMKFGPDPKVIKPLTAVINEFS